MIDEKIKINALYKDPIYIGTGGYKIGRVDNTIIRDPSTNEPKIPGSSLAGVWRYYSVLKIHDYLKEKYKMDKKKRNEDLEDFLKSKGKHDIKKLFNTDKNYVLFDGNMYIGIKCSVLCSVIIMELMYDSLNTLYRIFCFFSIFYKNDKYIYNFL